MTPERAPARSGLTALDDPAAGPDDVIAALAGTSETSRRRLWSSLDLIERRIAAHERIGDRPPWSARDIALLYSLAPPRAIADAWRAGRLPEELVRVAVDAAEQRDDEWRASFAALAHDQDSMLRSIFTIDVVAHLRRRGLVAPASAEHLCACLLTAFPPGVVLAVDRDPRTPAEREQDRVLVRDRELFLVLETEGAGWWDRDVDRLVEALQIDPPYRARLLDATLRGLLRDFSAHHIGLALALHRELDPTIDEVREREPLYVRVLLTQPSTAVGLAQGHLARLVDAPGDGPVVADLTALLDASGVVLARREKKAVLAQLRLLERLARRQPGDAARVAAAIATVLHDDRPDLVERARRILASIAPDAGADAAAELAASPTSTTDAAPPGSGTVAVPGPRRTPLPPADAPATLAPIDTADDLARLFTRLLEDPRPATDLVRAVDAVRRLRGQRPAAAAALVRRAVNRVQEFDGWRAGAPGPFVGDLVLAWLGERAPSRWGTEPTMRPAHPGPRLTLLLEPGMSVPDGVTVERTHTIGPESRSVDPSDLSERRVVWVVRPSAASPLSLMTRWLDEAATRARGSNGGDPPPLDAYVRAVHDAQPQARWRRATAVDDLPPWLHPHDRPPEDALHWVDEAAAPGSPADLSDVLLEHRPRLDDARFMPRFDAVVEWWAWLYAGSVDHLAAHLHPILVDAVNATSARGTAPAMAAIGASRRPLGPPALSALALGMSDKTAAGRSRAAEAVASLADSGLLDAAALARQLALCLDERRIQAARVAGALADAASISAIAGWRVLEVLVELLPVAARATGGVRLVELAAVLAPRYGVAPVIPAELAAKGRGSSAMALAIRTLQACEPNETPLALAAAESAAVAVRDS